MAGNLEAAQDNNKTGGGEMDFTYDRRLTALVW